MVALATIEAHGQILDGVLSMAVQDLAAVYGSLTDSSPTVVRDVLLEAVPDIVDPYAQATADLGATFYEQVREEAGVSRPFTAETVALPDRERYSSLVRWAVTPLFEQAAAVSALMLLSGGVQRALMDMSRDTVAGNAALDPVPVAYQRVPAPGCCAFCGMLASRGAVYSEASARGVVGRGMPVPKVRRSGGQARGIRPRGAQAVGEKYHDFCRCKGVPVFPGDSAEMQADADRYLDVYTAARDRVSEGQQWVPGERDRDGNRTSKGRWVDAAGQTRDNDQKQAQILSFMRADLGVS